MGWYRLGGANASPHETAMALTNCKECGNQVSTDAESCPYCGFKPKRSLLDRRAKLFLFAFLGAAVIAAALSPETSETERQERVAADKLRYQRIEIAADAASKLKSIMRNPDTFILEAAVVTTDDRAACFGYRSQNGFGGMNRENAVFDLKTNEYVTTPHRQFESTWKKLCSGPNVDVLREIEASRAKSTLVRWAAPQGAR